jgi:rhamnosyltransferase
MKYIAGIVLFNPDLTRLKDNINALRLQVEEIFLVDNGSTNIGEIANFFINDNIITIFRIDQNSGIAIALNRIIEYAYINKYEWVLTLDQDSVVSDNLLNVYSKYLNLEGAAMLSCTVNDRNYLSESCTLNLKEVISVSMCITSGCLNNVQIIKSLGGFDNKMFIDQVDTEMCHRIIKNGFKIYLIPNAVVLHELGRSVVHHFFGYSFISYNHQPLRSYYYFRNLIYMGRKHRMTIKKQRILKRLLTRFFIILFFEHFRFRKIKYILLGINDGFRMKIVN